jgi:dipeptidyl aminopeptidase/acylaminoacyl peptidase
MTPEEYLDALMSLPGMWNPQVSRDGKWVAWVWFNTAPAAEVYVAPTDGSAAPVRLSDTADNTYLVGWTPDSSAIIVSQDKDGNERAQLFRIDIDTPLTMIPLTEKNPEYFIRGGQLHPNGKWLVYGANFHFATGQEIEQTCVYRQDIETGELLMLARPVKGGYNRPNLSPTGEQIVYTRVDLLPGGEQTWIVDIDGKNDRELLNFGDDVKTSASWFPDGQRLVVQVETKTHAKLGVMTLTDGKIEWLIDDATRNIENAYAPANSDKIVVVEVNNARNHCTLLDPDSGEEIALADVPGNLIPIAPAEDGQWIGMYFSSQQPNDVVRFALDAKNTDEFTSISRVWEKTSISADDLTQTANFTWKAKDGLQIQGWLYRTDGDARGTVLYVHGGPTSHSRDAINNQIQYFVRQGFNVLDPNYRGSTGFSLEFREAIKKNGWGSDEIDDLYTGIEALIEQGIAQPGKVGMTGTSNGGYCSWCAITRFPVDILAAAAPVCGMTDMVVDYETTRPDLRPYSEELFGGSPTDVPELYYERSPVNFVENIKGQLLIVQGTQDPNVSPENVRTVAEALQKAHVEYGTLPFENEGHGISKPSNKKVLYKELYEFFDGAFDEE